MEQAWGRGAQGLIAEFSVVLSLSLSLSVLFVPFRTFILIIYQLSRLAKSRRGNRILFLLGIGEYFPLDYALSMAGKAAG